MKYKLITVALVISVILNIAFIVNNYKEEAQSKPYVMPEVDVALDNALRIGGMLNNNWDELSELRNLDSDVKIALVTEDDPLLAIQTALALKAVAINPNYKDLNKVNVSKIFKSGLKIFTWTVNNKADIIRVKSLMVNGIITDFPDRI